MIVSLAGWVYSEYVNNTYFQTYVNGLSPTLLPIVSVGLGITSATIATLLYVTMRNIRQRDKAREENSPRRHVQTRKAVEKPITTSSKTERTTNGGTAMRQRAGPSLTDASGPRRGTAEARNENE